jgi:cyclopropane fatty-acyl-phospholipid synthase-like methyltransferase
MSRFGTDPLAFFNSVYDQTPPWEIGGPQPAMSALLEKFPPADPILDVGCGSGDLAIYLAQMGHQVVGIDFVEVAIQQAKEKARSLPSDVARLLDFQVADALKPSLLQQAFGAIVDSGFFHLFDPAQCAEYIDELALALRPDGRFYLHAFAIDFSIPNVPRHVTTEELRSSFTLAMGWRILDIQSVEFLSRVAPPVPAISGCMERVSIQPAV